MQKKKDKFFEKIVKKNYNDELEEVLEKKYFAENVKSTLLSILYRIEAAYKDYEQVKQNVEPKEEFIQNIIDIIEKNCDDIKLVRPNSEESKMLGKKTFSVEKNKKRIICYPIERKLLYAIAKIGKNSKIIKSEYFLIDKTLSDLINTGNNINMVEPLRDFNGYSWTTISREIESIEHNLIYQNLRILIGYSFLDNWIKNQEFIIDYLELFQTRLEEKYGEKNAKEWLELLKKISILLEIKFDNKAKKKMIEIKREIDKKIEEIQDNQNFVKQVATEKKELTQEIKKIDETVNNKQMLQEEYLKRNENLPLEKKIFSVRILSQMMEKEREEKIKQLEHLNYLLIPKNFVVYKEELKEKAKYLDLLEVDNAKQIKETMLKLQKSFLTCFVMKIQQTQIKQDIIKLLYEFRYYCLLPYEVDKTVIEEKTLEKSVKEVGMALFQKAQKEKVIESIVENKDLEYAILKHIFAVRIIRLEDLYIKLTKEKDKFYLQLFDEDVFEEKIEIPEIKDLNKKELQIRLNKKIKLFL